MQLEHNDKNLNTAVYVFSCTKQSKKGDKPYKAHLLPNYLVLTRYESNTPKYQLPIELSTHIKWEVSETLIDGKKTYKLLSFKFQQVKRTNEKSIPKVTCFQAPEKELLHLKDLLRNRIIFQRIQDFYTPLQTLGKGSSARVLLVRHKTSEQYYAAKCIDKSYVNESENGLESMFQEISIQRQMDHPSFITLHAVYEGDNTFYMVMDLLEGKSLHDELQNHRDGFPLNICKLIMTQILKGVEYMHTLGIMHRDLKPENIMLQKKHDLNTLKIVDFGLATRENIDRYLFPKCGTPGYVAPEIANLVEKNVKYDKVCDIFSAGVIFYKIISGKDLFPGSGFNLVLKLNKQCKIDLTALQMKKIQGDIICLISRMLEKDPKLRPSATEILKDPFFADQIKTGPTAAQKKAFFQSLKGDKNSQTAEFSLSSDEHTHQKPPATIVGMKQQQIPTNTGSFVAKDNIFIGLNNSNLKQTSAQKPKFNTTEFDQYNINYKKNSIQEQVVENIEEEDEQQKK